MRVAVIGSGIAGVSLASTLVDRGLKPVILDVGEVDHENRTSLIKGFSKQSPNQWDRDTKKTLFVNPSLKNRGAIPKKFSFGSDYFYGKSVKEAEVSADGVLPPFSYAKGGFSTSWGASVLPPDDQDILDWPVKSKELGPYYKKILNQVPFSATNDDLERTFPLYTDQADPLRLDRGNREILSDLTRFANRFDQNNVVFGQSRLLTRATTQNDSPGCQYCGQCLSGCVYDCIYKADQTLESLLRSQKVEYLKDVLVDSLQESHDQVKIFAHSKGTPVQFEFERVFLAAGAVNSTRIVLNSKKLYNQNVTLLSCSSLVAPMLRFRPLPGSWPNSNTQPGLFFEFKVEELSNHWVHTQLSTPNELIYEMLGIREIQGPFAWLKKKATEHLVIAHCNIHSNHSNGYDLKLDQNNVLHSTRQNLPEHSMAFKLVKNRLSFLGKKFGCHVLNSQVKDSSRGGGYHVGGTMPMSLNPKSNLNTNLLGNPIGWTRIHVVDSSILPSLPATTIGLASMANARRIGTEVPLQ
jgi:choline dehydrogenase-like flavoprotein